MQYVRSISGSVSKTWNSINPATLSGAIDVIVVEQQDGSYACSPFHVRFGKFSLLRPHEKKVDFKVNGEKQDFPMKLGEGGEAFFVFETTNSIPEALQTSPLVSPVSSPEIRPTSAPDQPTIAEPDPLDLADNNATETQKEADEQGTGIPIPGNHKRSKSVAGGLSSSLGEHPKPPSPKNTHNRSALPAYLHRHHTDHALPPSRVALSQSFDNSQMSSRQVERPHSPNSPLSQRSGSPTFTNEEAMTRAINLSKKLWGSNIPSQVTEQGDLMLDMTGYKSSDDEALRAEVIARKILSDEMEGNYDIGSLIGADEKGNLWIYSSEEAKEKANRKIADGAHDLQPLTYAPPSDAVSDPGYHSDDARSESDIDATSSRRISHIRHGSDSAVGMSSPPYSPGEAPSAGDPNRNYAKTLRLTSDQLKALDLKPGQNSMSFTVNRATCQANLWLWRYDVPIVISDIDGTITKSDALGHVLNMIGRDWTHLGVAKLYTDIVANGYNIMYLTSRSIGQADTTRTYLSGVVQEGGYKLPKGPVILSPDRTIAALRREIYLRKPEVFKMACLRDIMALFSGQSSGAVSSYQDPTLASLRPIETSSRISPFYAGFGNRLTDALSYRSVNIPSTRIFTINSSAEVSLDLLSLNKYKTGYSSMREIVDHFFPPVGLLVKSGGEEYTDFNYWRDKPLDIEDFSGSESDDADSDQGRGLDEDDDEGEDIDDDGPDDEEDEDDEDGEEYEDEFGRRVREVPGGRHSEDEGALGESFVSYASDTRVSLEASIFGSVRGNSIEEDRRHGTQKADEEDEELATGEMELDEQQVEAQMDLRTDLKSLAKALSSPGTRAHRDDESVD